MKYNTQSVLETVFPGETAREYKIRLTLLYSALLNSIRAEDIELVFDEIIQCEQLMAESTKLSITNFNVPTAGDILSGFSSLAFECAKLKNQTGKNMLLAFYAGDIFDMLIDDKSIIHTDIRKQYSHLISETIMDFRYASGATDCMSLRMHDMSK